VARRAAILDLSFQHNTKPGLSFEVIRLAGLFERERRGLLPHLLSTPVRPEFHTVYLGIRGRGAITVDFTPVPVGAGRATVSARGRVMQFAPASGLDAYMLMFSPEFLSLGRDSREVDALRTAQTLSPAWPTPTLALDRDDRHEVMALAAQLEAEQARPFDAIQPALMSALLRSVLLRLERRARSDQPPAPAEVERFFTILDRDCLRTRSVDHYARTTGISPRRLGELLAEHTGKSTKRLVDDRVILELKRLLVHTDVSVKELAERSGFEEPTNLVKFFRKHTRTTPLEFRVSARRMNLPSGRRS
jgi:AraC-like DNA-binding protein